MKYYQIDRTGDSKIIGIKNGTSQVELLDGNIEKNECYKNFVNHFNGSNIAFWQNQTLIFGLKPPVIKGKMRKNAKVTDLMWYGQAYHFLFEIYSKKYIDIIKSFDIGKMKIFDFEIEDVLNKYYLMFIETILLDEVDFKKSTIVTGFKHLKTIKYHNINNREEYHNFKQQNPISTFEKIVIDIKYKERDIISVQGAGKLFYSERIIDFLIDCNVTGLDIKYNNSIELVFSPR